LKPDPERGIHAAFMPLQLSKLYARESRFNFKCHGAGLG